VPAFLGSNGTGSADETTLQVTAASLYASGHCQRSGWDNEKGEEGGEPNGCLELQVRVICSELGWCPGPEGGSPDGRWRATDAAEPPSIRSYPVSSRGPLECPRSTPCDFTLFVTTICWFEGCPQSIPPPNTFRYLWWGVGWVSGDEVLRAPIPQH
jgi:hypothetical protein